MKHFAFLLPILFLASALLIVSCTTPTTSSGVGAPILKYDFQLGDEIEYEFDYGITVNDLRITSDGQTRDLSEEFLNALRSIPFLNGVTDLKFGISGTQNVMFSDGPDEGTFRLDSGIHVDAATIGDTLLPLRDFDERLDLDVSMVIDEQGEPISLSVYFNDDEIVQRDGSNLSNLPRMLVGPGSPGFAANLPLILPEDVEIAVGSTWSTSHEIPFNDLGSDALGGLEDVVFRFTSENTIVAIEELNGRSTFRVITLLSVPAASYQPIDDTTLSFDEYTAEVTTWLSLADKLPRRTEVSSSDVALTISSAEEILHANVTLDGEVNQVN